jgi:hypothetical protein
MTPVCPPPASDCPAVFLLTCREHGARGVRLYWSGKARGWTISADHALRYPAYFPARVDLSEMTVLEPAWVEAP